MASKQFNFSVDLAPITLTVDLAPPFYAMEMSNVPIELFRGDNASINFAVTQNGQVFDLTGYTVLYQAKAAFGDASFVFNKTATITNATGGLCRADLVGSDINAAQTLNTQLYLTQTGLTQTILQLPLVVLPSV